MADYVYVTVYFDGMLYTNGYRAEDVDEMVEMNELTDELDAANVAHRIYTD